VKKRYYLLFLVSLFCLTACSEIPVRLKRTADRSTYILNHEMEDAIGHRNYEDPIFTDSCQLSEERWCLTYKLGPEFSFSSLWEKQEQEWVQIELKPYVDNCNWAR
jgi:hypothetical protein